MPTEGSDESPVERMPRGRGSTTTRHRFSLQHIELLLVAATLLATVSMSWLTLHQTTRHFRLQRTAEYVSRFNSNDLVTLREHADRWFEGSESIQQLFERAKGVASASPNPNAALGADDAIATISRIRTLANFFQEFGTALKAGCLDDQYAHDLLGGVCIRYGIALEPFILQMRVERKRPQVYQEVVELRNAMLALEGQPPIPLPSGPSPTPPLR